MAKGMPHPRLPGVTFQYGGAVLRSVPDIWGIAASVKGDIWSIRSGRWRRLSQWPSLDKRRNQPGYLRTCIRVFGKPKTLYVHQMVAAAWHGPRPDNHEVDHDNWDNQDNRPDNLRYLPCDEHNIRTRAHEEMTTEDWEAIL